MCKEIEELGDALMAINDDSPGHPTAEDHEELMSIKDQIDRLPIRKGLVLSSNDKADLFSLSLIVEVKASKHKGFFNGNQCKWAKEAA